MNGNERSHLLATDSLDECLPHPVVVQKQRSAPRPVQGAQETSGGPCKRPEDTQIRVPNELREQTRLALVLFVSSHAHDQPGFYSTI